MVERGGGCSNLVKVRNIEKFGAKVALIANYAEADEVVMHDKTGGSSDINIPAYMVDYDDAGLLKEMATS